MDKKKIITFDRGFWRENNLPINWFSDWVMIDCFCCESVEGDNDVWSSLTDSSSPPIVLDDGTKVIVVVGGGGGAGGCCCSETNRCGGWGMLFIGIILRNKTQILFMFLMGKSSSYRTIVSVCDCDCSGDDFGGYSAFNRLCL